MRKEHWFGLNVERMHVILVVASFASGVVLKSFWAVENVATKSFVAESSASDRKYTDDKAVSVQKDMLLQFETLKGNIHAIETKQDLMIELQRGN